MKSSYQVNQARTASPGPIRALPPSSRRSLRLALPAAMIFALAATAAEYEIRQIADPTLFNRQPSISEDGLVAWYAFSMRPMDAATTHIHVYQDGERRVLSEGVTETHSGNTNPQVSGTHVAWVSTFARTRRDVTWTLRDPPLDDEIPELDARWRPRTRGDGQIQWFDPPLEGEFQREAENAEEIPPSRRTPSGNKEIMFWDGDEVRRITFDNRNNIAPSVWGTKVAFQTARGWPFGWEIMLWDNGELHQITTNYYYDMGPQVHNNQIVWYGWDGNDYEIFLYDHDRRETMRVTDNDYDCISPVLWDGVIAFEGFPSLNADIFIWRDGDIQRISDNIEDDINPRIWNGEVVWQGFDGSYYQIYYFDGNRTIKLTDTLYDNINPDIRDGIITWMGYVDNFDAEIFVWDGGPDPIRLTDNDYEDRHPRTAGGRIVWQADDIEDSHIFLAEPAP